MTMIYFLYYNDNYLNSMNYMNKTILIQKKSHLFVVVLVLGICSPHELNLLTCNLWSTYMVLDVGAIWHPTDKAMWQILEKEDIDNMDRRKNIYTRTQQNTLLHDPHNTW